MTFYTDTTSIASGHSDEQIQAPEHLRALQESNFLPNRTEGILCPDSGKGFLAQRWRSELLLKEDRLWYELQLCNGRSAPMAVEQNSS